MNATEIQAIREQLNRAASRVIALKAKLDEQRKRCEAGSTEYESLPTGCYWGDRGLAPALHAALTAAVGAIANPIMRAEGLKACDAFRSYIMNARRNSYTGEAPGYETDAPLAWAKLLDEHLLALADKAVDEETAELRKEISDAAALLEDELEGYLLAVDEKGEAPFRERLANLVQVYIEAKHAIPAWVAAFKQLRGHIAIANEQMKKLTAAVRSGNMQYVESYTGETTDAVRRLGDLLTIPNEA